QRKKYTPEYRREAANLVIESQRPIAHVAKEIGVSATILGRWVGPDPRKVDTSGVSYAAWVSVAEFSASKTSGAERLHQECRRRV
ncbi:transposase, partial [Corynebacterium sp. MSK122]|uniref:transposase n=1 Tax=Corynebacterium sp. MSK122 TaxID=3050206 RepID=UPI003AEF6277